MWWSKLPFLDRIRQAAALGFPAIEFWPWENKDINAIADLTGEPGRKAHDVSLEEMASPWFLIAASGEVPPGWSLADRLAEEGHVGALVPSFAVNAEPHHKNLVLWRWGPELPSKVAVYDPSGRLPKNSLSWD